jgi:hypothetical protein
VEFLSDETEPDPWGGRQPRFERLEFDGQRGFFLVGQLVSGEPVRLQLTSASYQQRPPEE